MHRLDVRLPELVGYSVKYQRKYNYIHSETIHNIAMTSEQA